MGSDNMEIGKTYKIEDLIEELEKTPDIQLGHIVIAGIHKYHQNKRNLEDILMAAMIGIAKEEKPPVINVTVLSIINPFERYVRFIPFYNSIERDILYDVEKSLRGEIAISMENMIEEVKKFGITNIEEKKQFNEFLSGLKIYFMRKKIVVDTISSGKYLTFKKV